MKEENREFLINFYQQRFSVLVDSVTSITSSHLNLLLSTCNDDKEIIRRLFGIVIRSIYKTCDQENDEYTNTFFDANILAGERLLKELKDDNEQERKRTILREFTMLMCYEKELKYCKL